jgi:hypothetical protein
MFFTFDSKATSVGFVHNKADVNSITKHLQSFTIIYSLSITTLCQIIHSLVQIISKCFYRYQQKESLRPSALQS